MTKKQQETLDILKSLVEKQKATIAEKDATISELVQEDYEEIKARKIELENKVDALEEKIESLEGRLLDDGEKEKIDCGIGFIEYAVPHNLQLRIIMESFEECIKKQGPQFILEALQILSA